MKDNDELLESVLESGGEVRFGFACGVAQPRAPQTPERDTRPLFVELFAGLHGWGEGAAAEGFRVVGFDLYDMCAVFGKKRPAGIQIVLQDVLTLHGSQFRDAAVIVASPPCQKYSYLAMPWSRSKCGTCKGAGQITAQEFAGSLVCSACNGTGENGNSKTAKALRKKWETEGPDNRLFDACFRIQREAIEATRCASCDGSGWIADPWPESTTGWSCGSCNGYGGRRYIPLIVENVRGAQPWVGRSAWNFGSFHLWGDVPALMPINLKRGQKVPGFRFDGSGGSFQTASVNATQGGVKVPGQVHGTEYAFTRTGANGQTVLGTRDGATKQDIAGKGEAYGGGFGWDGSAMRTGNSKSNARKMASAQIAKIPFELASHIAQVYYPKSLAQGRRLADAAGKT